MKKLKEFKINWEEYIIPSKTGKDVKLFHKICKENFDYTPPKLPKSIPTIFNKKVGLREWGKGDETLGQVSLDNEVLKEIPQTLKVWKEGTKMVEEMLDYYEPVITTPDDPQPYIGCSCGIVGNKPYGNTTKGTEIGVMSTVNTATGACEGIVHELGHHKMHALGLELESFTGDLFINSPEELFRSPVRFDKLRPISAVVHAEFSYVYVTEFYNHLIRWLIDEKIETFQSNNTRDYQGRNAYNLKRIGNGIHTIKEVSKLTPTGQEFMKVLLTYACDVWERGYSLLKEQDLLDQHDWEPELGNPLI